MDARQRFMLPGSHPAHTQHYTRAAELAAETAQENTLHQVLSRWNFELTQKCKFCFWKTNEDIWNFCPFIKSQISSLIQVFWRDNMDTHLFINKYWSANINRYSTIPAWCARIQKRLKLKLCVHHWSVEGKCCNFIFTWNNQKYHGFRRNYINI